MNRDSDIQALLEELEKKHAIRILYACESGSRAWGFASPDSDYDIRFLYSQLRSRYLQVFRGADTIEVPIEDDLDPGGWDVRKAAGLLNKSNGALVEWLHSPIVYREETGFLDQWRSVCREVFSVRDSVAHYRGLALQIWRGKCGGEQVRAKDYLYVLRALLAAQWVLTRREPAPVQFEELRGEAFEDEIDQLLDWKARSGEKELMARMPSLDLFIESTLEEVGAKLSEESAKELDNSQVEKLFTKTLRLGEESKGSELSISGVRRSSGLLFDTVAGSRAYGTHHARSDEDRRGVFVAPMEMMSGFDPVEQVSDAKSDEVYYELRRFGELLVKNNPNALELLAMPSDCVRFQHSSYSLLTPDAFLSKLCGRTFGNYAMGQIRKARGLNKKIVNPQPKERQGLLDFCFILEGQGSVGVREWLASRGLNPESCGLVGVEHSPGVFALFYDSSGEHGYRGLVSKLDDSALVCSSVPKDAQPAAWMTCNRDAFKAHCRRHREYWEWVELRNEDRYETNTEHGRGYDSKNLMHTLRLLDMAEEIAVEGVIRVRRPNREWLARVRGGEFSYDELVNRAEDQMSRVETAFAESSLPERPDERRVQEILNEIRDQF